MAPLLLVVRSLPAPGADWAWGSGAAVKLAVKLRSSRSRLGARKPVPIIRRGAQSAKRHSRSAQQIDFWADSPIENRAAHVGDPVERYANPAASLLQHRLDCVGCLRRGGFQIATFEHVDDEILDLLAFLVFRLAEVDLDRVARRKLVG